MMLLHRVMINLRRVCITAYYKLIYGSKFQHGTHFKFRGAFRLYLHDKGRIEFGDNVFLNNYFSATAIDSIKIGDNCIFGEGVKIYDHNHSFKDISIPIAEQPLNSRPVVIGNNCWIASNVTILAGVHVGDNCVIGANCLVYKDIPANSIVKHNEEYVLETRGGGLMPPKISIIIPVYKVERYLRRCLESVCSQTLKEIEIILIDDGSPDNCGQICDEYKKKDPRIRVIHKQNAGVSAARNSGLEIASGEYIGFVDSDDYIAPNMFEELYKALVILNADISMCHFKRVGEGNSDWAIDARISTEFECLSRKQAFETIADFSKPLLISIWNKLFKREILAGLKFDTSKRMAEDCEFLFKALVKCGRVAYLPSELYGYYDQREGAATFHGDQDLDWYYESAENIEQIMDDVIRVCPELREIAIGFKCVNGDMSLANAMVRSSKFDKKAIMKIKSDLRKNWIDILRSELHAYKKIQMMVFLLSPTLYSALMNKKLRG